MEFMALCLCTCLLVTRYTFLQIDLHYSADLQVAVTCQEAQHSTGKGNEEDFQQVNMVVNNAGFKLWRKIREGSAFNTFV